MKKILFILSFFITVAAFSQPVVGSDTKVHHSNYDSTIINSNEINLKGDTITHKAGIVFIGSKLYVGNGSYFVDANTLKLNISDTTAAFNNYYNKTYINSRFGNVVNTDTSFVGSNYFNKTYITANLAALSGAYFPLIGGSITGTAGSGYVGYISQSATPSTPSSGFRLYADATNRLAWIGTNGFTRTFDGTSNTASRVYTLPDATGTVPLLESTQSWSGANTFSGVTRFTSGTASTSTTTGSVVVTGGLGASGNGWFGGVLNSQTVSANSSVSGNGRVSGITPSLINYTFTGFANSLTTIDKIFRVTSTNSSYTNYGTMVGLDVDLTSTYNTGGGYYASYAGLFNGGLVGINTTAPTALLQIGGTNLTYGVNSTTWGTNGIALSVLSATYKDQGSASGTVSTHMAINSFAVPTINSYRQGVFYTNASTVYIAGSPLVTNDGGTASSITNPWSLYVAAGNSYFGGMVTLANTTDGFGVGNASLSTSGGIYVSKLAQIANGLIVNNGRVSAGFFNNTITASANIAYANQVSGLVVTSGSTASSGTTPTLAGIQVSGLTNTTGHTITNATSMWLTVPYTNTGTITSNAYLAITGTSLPTGNWSIYNAGTYTNYTAGRSLFGTLTDDGNTLVQIAGGVKVSNGQIFANGLTSPTSNQAPIIISSSGSSYNEGLFINPSTGNSFGSIIFANAANSNTGAWALVKNNTNDFYLANQSINSAAAIIKFSNTTGNVIVSTIFNSASSSVAPINITSSGSSYNEGIVINPSTGNSRGAIVFANTAGSITGAWVIARKNTNDFFISNEAINSGNPIFQIANTTGALSLPLLNVAGVMTNTSAGVVGTQTYASLATSLSGQTMNIVGSSTSVTNSLILKADGGTTEGTSQYTFNGSSAKTLNIAAGTNITITKASGVWTISAAAGGGSMVYPSAGIAVSNGSAWVTSITDNSTNWNTAYDRSGTSLTFTSSTLTFTKQDASTLTVSVPTFNQNTTGSAATLTTARTINGVSFNGSANITVTADASTLTGTTLNSGVTASSLTSLGTITLLSAVAINASSDIYSTTKFKTAGNLQLDTDSTGLKTTTGNYRFYAVQSGMNAWYTPQNMIIGGNMTAAGFFESSDIRLKNVVSQNGDMIQFTWKNGDAKLHFGYIAQEVEKIMPDQVNTDSNGFKSVNYIEVLVKKLNDLENKVAELQKRVNKGLSNQTILY